MNPESFHVIQDILNEPYGPTMVVAIILVLPVGFAFVYWVYRRRVHPVAVWATLTAALIGGSQIFPENRPKLGEFAISSPVISAAVTALLFYRIRRARSRQAEKQGTSAEAKRPRLFRS